MASHMSWMIVVDGVHQNKLRPRSPQMPEAPNGSLGASEDGSSPHCSQNKEARCAGLPCCMLSRVEVFGGGRRFLPFGAIQFADSLGTQLEHAIPHAILFVLARADWTLHHH